MSIVMIAEVRKPKSSDFIAVSKAINSFLKALNQTSNSKIITENISYSDFFENKMLIIKIIRKGMPYKLFEKIRKVTPFTDDDWAEYLNISKKTMQRHQQNENYVFKPIHTEKIIELAEVTNFGKDVFDSTEQFYVWLNTPSYALGNLHPSELLKDSYGKDMVMAELNRITHGIFA